MNLYFHRWTKPLVTCATLVSVAIGCESQHPTAPREIVAPLTAAVRGDGQLRVAPDVFDDVIARLLPSFADQARAGELRERIAEFTAAYSTKDDVTARLALTHATALVQRGGAHAADLSALRLAISRAEALMDSTTTTGVAP